MYVVFILVLASGILIMLGQFSGDTRIRNIGALLLWFIMTILVVFRYDGSDVDVYQLQFYLSSMHDWDFWNEDTVSKETLQPLFFYLNKLFYELDLQFAALRFFIYFISMTCLALLIKKYTSNWSMVFCLYFIMPYNVDLMQTRNYLMSLMVLLSVAYMSDRHIKCRIKSGMTILTSGLFHSLGFIYLPFVFFDKLYKYKLFKLVIVISILSPIYVYYIINNAGELLNIMGLQNSIFALYLVYTQNMTSDAFISPYPHFIKNYVMSLLCMATLFYINKYIKNKDICNDKAQFINNTKNVWLLAIFLLPIMGITPSLDRIPRSILLPFYISLGIFWETVDRKIINIFFVFCIAFELILAGVGLNKNFINDYLYEIKSNYLIDLIEYF